MSTDLGRALAAPSTDGRSFRVGVVEAYNATAKTVTVRLDAGTVTAPSLSAAYTAGQSVLVARDGKAGAWVLGVIGTPPAPPAGSPPPPSPAAPTTVRRTKVAIPGQADTYRSGWRGVPDLYQGDYTGRGINFGAAFYGTQLRGLGALAGTARTGVLTYRRLAGGSYAAQVPTFRLLAQASKPAGAPTILATASGDSVTVGETETWTVPAAWVDQLLAGTAGGIGIQVASSTPYIHLAGPSSVANSMALAVTYYATA